MLPTDLEKIIFKYIFQYCNKCKKQMKQCSLFNGHCCHCKIFYCYECWRNDNFYHFHTYIKYEPSVRGIAKCQTDFFR